MQKRKEIRKRLVSTAVKGLTSAGLETNEFGVNTEGGLFSVGV